MKSAVPIFRQRKNTADPVEKEATGELFLCGLINKETYSPDRSSALAWKHANGRTSVEEVAALLAKETGTAADARLMDFALRG